MVLRIVYLLVIVRAQSRDRCVAHKLTNGVCNEIDVQLSRFAIRRARVLKRTTIAKISLPLSRRTRRQLAALLCSLIARLYPVDVFLNVIRRRKYRTEIIALMTAGDPSVFTLIFPFFSRPFFADAKNNETNFRELFRVNATPTPPYPDRVVMASVRR